MNPPSHNGGGRGTTHIFYKTRMCMKFMEGECRNGDSCNFAHGMADLREPPPNWQELVREKERGSGGNWCDDQRMVHRMKICKKFFNGEECPYGDKCNFLHEPPPKFRASDMGRARESSAISIGVTCNRYGSDQSDFNRNVAAVPDSLQTRAEFWKTRLCMKWENTGHCPFGDRCHFAHGQSELKGSAGRNDTETMATMNSIPAKPQPALPSVVIPVVTVGAASRKEEVEAKKDFSKWKTSKKINSIYGDWIDDLTPPQTFPSHVES